MKLVDILYEDTKPNTKFVSFLMPKLTEYFAGIYPKTDWFDAAHSLMFTTKGPHEYQAAAMNANIQMEELKELLSSINNVLNMDVDVIQKAKKRIFDLTRSVDNNLSMLLHLKDMFGSINQGNFMDNYSIPPGIMIEVWGRWKKEVYDPESIKREMTYGKQQLTPISIGDFYGHSNPEWEKYNPPFGQQDFWKWFSTHGMGNEYYVTSSYLEDSRGKEPLMFVAKTWEEMLSFIDDVEMEMAVDEITQYFTDIEARKVINYLRSLGNEGYEGHFDLEVEIGMKIKNYIDDHPEIHFDTDGDIDQTFTHIGEILNDYLNF